MEVIEEKSGGKYLQGRLHILLFDRDGARIKTIVSDTDNYVATIARADELLESGECASYAICRILMNSNHRRMWGQV